MVRRREEPKGRENVPPTVTIKPGGSPERCERYRLGRCVDPLCGYHLDDPDRCCLDCDRLTKCQDVCLHIAAGEIR